VIEWSQASYGPTFDAGGGGVFAMKWDSDGIAVCEPIGHDLIFSSLHRTHRVILQSGGS
jgi:hypothetical protein